MKTINTISNVYLWESSDDEVINGLNRFSYDYLSEDMDVIFKNKASWTKFCNRVDNFELTKWLENKHKDWYIKAIDYETIEVYSKDGFNISTGFFFENDKKMFIYDNYKKLKIKLSYDWLYSTTKITNLPTAIDIYGEIIWE